MLTDGEAGGVKKGRQTLELLALAPSQRAVVKGGRSEESVTVMK